MIKSEKELTHLVWKRLGLTRHGSDIKRKSAIAKEIHKAVEFMMEDAREDEVEGIFDDLAHLFLSKIEEMGEEEFNEIFYKNLLESTISKIDNKKQ